MRDLGDAQRNRAPFFSDGIHSIRGRKKGKKMQAKR
jgi:hypothetical protein